MISDIDLMVMRRRVMIMTKVMIKIDENYPIWHANEAKMKIPKNPERFPWNPGIKNIGKSRPEKSRDPGIWQNPVPKNPGIEILDPARACWWHTKTNTNTVVIFSFALCPSSHSHHTPQTQLCVQRKRQSAWKKHTICAKFMKRKKTDTKQIHIKW